MIKYDMFFLFLTITAICFKTINCLSGCENLSSDLCLAAYPQCQPLILTSCCPGQTALCLEIDTVINYSTNKQLFLTSCLRNIQSGIIYELWGEMNDIPGFEITKVPNNTCDDIGCKDRGFDCILSPVAQCVSESECCVPEPICDNFRKSMNSTESIYGSVDCHMECPPNYLCRLINDIQQCLPSNCSVVECPFGTECLPLIGLGVVSCFRSIDVSSNNDITCDNVECPEGFQCGKGVYSNADCIPNNFDILGNSFSCTQCPKGWICRLFGWNGFCVEWNGRDSFNEVPCIGGSCLSNQICNTTTSQCEFEPCNNNTCNAPLECIQYHSTQPRICIGVRIFPFIEIPSSLPPFTDRFTEHHDEHHEQ